MKKTLLATTMLVAGAGMAVADVTISGYGRFGLEYVENRDDDNNAATLDEETQFASRLRITINATTETDTGVTFGARLRMQNTDSATSTSGNTAMFWVAYEGLRVEFGNANTAHDSVALFYDSEMGFQDSSFGDAESNFYDYDSVGREDEEAGKVGIYASYSISDVNLHFSYVNPDQTGVVPGAETEDEIGIAADWSNGTFAVAAAYTTNGKGLVDNDIAFVGVAYSFNDAATVGLNYYDNGDIDGAVAGDLGDQWTLYGNYTMGATTLRAYVSEADFDSDGVAATDTAYGIGADYKLADGVRISGSVQSGHTGDTAADVGVRFDF